MNSRVLQDGWKVGKWGRGFISSLRYLWLEVFIRWEFRHPSHVPLYGEDWGEKPVGVCLGSGILIALLLVLAGYPMALMYWVFQLTPKGSCSNWDPLPEMSHPIDWLGRLPLASYGEISLQAAPPRALQNQGVQPGPRSLRDGWAHLSSPTALLTCANRGGRAGLGRAGL